MSQHPDINTLDAQVRAGLQADEFSAHYQPKFDPESEDIVGAEALLRWDHPDEGMRVAGWFMPSIERNEALIECVDTWVLNATTRQGKAWLEAGHPVGDLYVNVSAWHAGPKLVEMVETALKESNFPAKSLSLECPWRMLAADADTIAPTMRALRALGCTIVLDGNPLDQACLDVVNQTPVQLSKVCIEHLQDYADSYNTPKLASLIKTWRKRGVQIIAIGVEGEEQLTLSHQAGCRYAQGNRFKSALPADEITFLLKVIEKTKQALSLL